MDKSTEKSKANIILDNNERLNASSLKSGTRKNSSKYISKKKKQEAASWPFQGTWSGAAVPSMAVIYQDEDEWKELEEVDYNRFRVQVMQISEKEDGTGKKKIQEVAGKKVEVVVVEKNLQVPGIKQLLQAPLAPSNYY
jgi:hypothetical protein